MTLGFPAVSSAYFPHPPHCLDSEHQGPFLTWLTPRQAVPTLSSSTESPLGPCHRAHTPGPSLPCSPGGAPSRRCLPAPRAAVAAAFQEEAPVSTERRRRLCEPQAASGGSSGSAASPPAVALGSEGAPAAPPRPAGHVVPPLAAAPETPPGRRLHLRPREQLPGTSGSLTHQVARHVPLLAPLPCKPSPTHCGQAEA